MILIITGLVLVFSGISIILRPVFYSTKYSMVFDFSGIKYPLSLSAIAIGSYCVYVGARAYYSDEYMVDTWICPKCEELFKFAEKDKHYCSKCDISLERLEGFYDRHPEKK